MLPGMCGARFHNAQRAPVGSTHRYISWRRICLLLIHLSSDLTSIRFCASCSFPKHAVPQDWFWRKGCHGNSLRVEEGVERNSCGFDNRCHPHLLLEKRIAWASSCCIKTCIKTSFVACKGFPNLSNVNKE